MAYRLKGICLPDEVERELFVIGNRISFEPMAGAETIVDAGWLVPGLVDVHTHPGAEEPGDPFDAALFRSHIAAHRDAGVLTIRSPGLAARLPDDLREPSPRLISAGPWLAPSGGFFDGWGRQVALADLPSAAEDEARASDGWVKVVADWMSSANGERRYEPTIPPDVLAEVVRRAHAAGARVAVHTQHGDGAAAAVAAGADSIEHGMHLSEDLLDAMAARGIALVPTMHGFASFPEDVPDADGFIRFLLAGAARHPGLVRAAWEAGVTVLAGTDGLPHGNVAAEIAELIAAGLPPRAALGAASWTALEFLGLPGLEHDAPANIVAYENDPSDPTELRRPMRVIAAGRIAR